MERMCELKPLFILILFAVVNYSLTAQVATDYCGGDHFYDSGGPSSDYINDANDTIVICPDSPYGLVSVVFNSFNTESCCDYLEVFNGANTMANSVGTFSGTDLPEPIISTDNSGCLTFVFTSDYSVVREGWDATVYCDSTNTGIIQLGSGTGATGNTSASPVNVYYSNARMQMVYTADEINNLWFVGPKVIDQLSFYVESLPDHPLTNYKIRMGLTSATDVSNHLNEALFTVYSNSSYLPVTTGFDTLSLDSLFYWNGTDNIIVDICYDGLPSTNPSGTARYYSATNGLRHSRSNSLPQCSEETALTENYKFQCVMGLQEVQAVDAGIASIDSPSVPFLEGMNDVVVSLKNYGTSNLTNLTIKWSVNDTAQADYNWTGNLAPGTMASVNLGAFSFSTGNVYDIKAWTAATGDMVHSNDYAQDSLAPSLSGIYTIGGVSPDYLTISEAVQDLNAFGAISATFNIRSDTYNEQFVIEDFPGSSCDNPVVFQSETRDSSEVIIAYSASSSSDNWTVKLAGTEGVTLKHLTIQANGSSYATALEISESASCNTITNCWLTGRQTTSSNSRYAVIYSPNGNSTDKENNNVFTNNLIEDGGYGIYWRAYSTSVSYHEQGNVFEGNIFENQGYRGIYMLGQDSAVISANTINRSGSFDRGIYIEYSSNQRILKNRIQCDGGIGMHLYDCDGTNGDWGLITNNFIAIGGSSTANGIQLEYGSYQKVYYNNVNITSDYTYARSFYNTYYGSNIEVLNNNFVNSGGGIAYYTNSTNAIIASDHNNIYTTGTVLGYWSSDISDLSQWQTASSMDSNSVSIDPWYISDTDLHVRALGLFNMGQPVAEVTEDIDGELRDAVTPSIGADEFVPAGVDAGIEKITAPEMPFAVGTRPVKVLLRNYGTATLNSVMINWTLNDSLQTTYNWNGSLASGDSASVTLSNVNFVLDSMYGINAWTSNPNATQDELTANDTALTSVTLYAGLAGTYTIGGASPDFDSLGQAVSALNSGGAAGPVTFNIRTGTYNEQVSITDFPGTSCLIPVIFQSETGDSSDVIITYAATNSNENWTIQLAGSKGVTLRDFTIQASGTSYARALDVRESASCNTVNSCRLIGYQTTSSSTSYSVIYSPSGGSTDKENNNIFSNNQIEHGGHGIYWEAYSTSANYLEHGNVLEGNVFSNQGYRSIYMYSQDSLRITSNTIARTGSYDVGIYVNRCPDPQLSKNRVQIDEGRGIYLYYCYGDAGNGGLIANNFVTVGGTGTSYGITLYNCSYQSVYFNNVYVTSTDANGGRAFYNATYYSTTGNKIINNNFANSGGGYAYYAGYPSAISVSDHNNLYTTGPNLGYWSGDITDLNAWQAASSKDSNSISFNPNYVSSNDLHVNKSDLDGAGLYVSEVTDDIDGEARDTLNPDIGADEFTPTGASAGIIGIDQGAVAPFNAGTYDITVVLKNSGAVILDSVEINWSVNSVPQTVYNWTGALPGLSFDTVNIGSVTYDSLTAYEITVWVTDPNGETDVDPGDDTLAVGNIYPALSGVYTIGGTSPSFDSIGHAVMQLNYGGISGPVTFNIRTGIYNEQVSITDFPGTTCSTPVVFQAESGDSSDVVLAYTASSNDANWTVQLAGANGITLKHLTIQANGTSYATALDVRENASCNTVMNCLLTGYQTTSSSNNYAVIYSPGGPYSPVETDKENNNTFTNNLIENGGIGIDWRAYSTSSTYHEHGNVFVGNILNNQGYRGMYVYGQDSVLIESNELTETGYDAGININGCPNPRILKNKVESGGGTGIYLSSCYGTNSNWGLVTNNFVTIGGTGTAYGIYLRSCDYQNVYYNNVLITNTGGSSRAFYNYSYYSSYYTQKIINNNFINTGGGYAYYANPYAISISDHNNLYTTGPNIGYWNGNITDLSAWQLASSKDSNSISFNPSYVSTTDLHVSKSDLNGAGLYVPEVTDDIDGEARDTLNPDIGADEFTPSGASAGVLGIDNGAIAPFNAGTYDINVVLKNSGADILDSVNIYWSVNSVTQTIYSWTGALPVLGFDTVNIGSITYDSLTAYEITVWVTYPNGETDIDPGDDTLSVANIYPALNGVYTIGGTSSSFDSISHAVTQLKYGGISGPVTFNIRSGTYNEQVMITDFPGASCSRPVIFQSESGDSSDVIIAYAASNSNENWTIQLAGASGVTLKQLTIQANGIVYTTALDVRENAGCNTVMNCRLTGYQTTSGNSRYSVIYSPGGSSTHKENNNVFANNLIEDGGHGIYWEAYSSSSTYHEQGNVFEDNFFNNQGYRGIYVYGQDSVLIGSNQITRTGYFDAGIYLNGCTNPRVLKNKLQSDDGYGIYLSSCYATNGDWGLVANNFVTIGGTGTTYGIYLYNCDYQNIYYNNVLITSTGSTSSAFYTSYYYSNDQKVVNNNFVNTGGGYACYISATNAITQSDHNNLYTTGTNIGYWSGVVTDLGNWQSTSGFDANSLSEDPQFTDSTDLHIGNPFLNAAGTPVPEVTTDIDGEARDPVNPDIGADEFISEDNNVGIEALISPSTGCEVVEIDSVTIRIKNYGLVAQTGFNLGFNYDTLSVIENIGSVVVAAEGGTYEYTFNTAIDVTNVDTFTIEVFTLLANDELTNNDTIVKVVSNSDAFECEDGDPCTIDSCHNGVCIYVPSGLSANIAATDVTFPGGSNGSADLSVSGGFAPYIYSWSNFYTLQDISGLTAGRYYVTVTDDNGCEVFDTVTINEPPQLPCSFTIDAIGTDAILYGGNNGSMDVSITDTTDNCGGTWSVAVFNGDGDQLYFPSCGYQWTSGCGTPFSVTGLPADTFIVRGQNACGCADTTVIVISEPAEENCSFTINATTTDATINGVNNGRIDFDITDSTDNCGGTWDITLRNQGGNQLYFPSCGSKWTSACGNPGDIDDLPAGSYTITGKNACGCTDTIAGLVIAEPDSQTLSINSLPATIGEGNTVIFQVATSGAPSTPLQVYLASSNQARFSVPASVTIPAGSLSVDVTVTLLEDSIPEIDDEVVITAGAANNEPARDTVIVTDNDVPGLDLVLQTDTVSESAGYYATEATLIRTSGSNTRFTVNISASLSNTLILPGTITLAENENQKTFTVGVIDNGTVEGVRNVEISAAIFVASCGCNAPASSAGFVTDTLTVLDNDGPSLTLTATPLAMKEGLANAGSLRVTRNTPTGTALNVTLTSSNANEATVPSSVTIAQGDTYADVPVTTINDGVTDGNQQVYFQASASGFSPGVVWATVTDANKPDLQIPSVTVSDTVLDALGVFNYTVSVTNTGFATAPSGVVVRGYLSDNIVIDASDTLISEDIITVPIPVGATKQVLKALTVPNIPGDHKLLFKVNPATTISELLYSNNTSHPADIYIQPDYTATASVSGAYFPKGTSVSVTGTAVKKDSTAAKNVEVEVYILTGNGLRREVIATTDNNGNYTAQFVPLANESGHYTVGASFPGIQATETQDEFDILGVSVNGGQIPQFQVLLYDSISGTLSLENLSNTDLHNFTIAPVDLPDGAEILFDTIPVLAGNAITTIGYAVKGNSLTQGTDFVVAELQAICDESDIQPVYAFYYCKAPGGYIVADIASINTTVSQTMGERLVEFRLINNGSGATDNIEIDLPQVSWLTAVTPDNMIPLAPDDTGLVILKFLATADVPFGYPVTGNFSIGSQNSNYFSIPFTFEKVSDTTGTVEVEVVNQYTYFDADEPKVVGALVKIQNYYSGEVYAQGYTDSDGIFTAPDLPEGTHRIIVEKEQHLPYSKTVTIDPGAVVHKTVFINYQAVTFSWDVEPTAIEDEYSITLTSVFETHVPMPVVIMELPDTMPQLLGDEEFHFYVTLTNHGLITANDVSLNLPEGDVEYEFVTNYVPGNLAALQSVQVPVVMKRRDQALAQDGGLTIEGVSQFLGIGTPQFRLSNGGPCSAFPYTVYWYECGDNGLWEKHTKQVTYKGRSCGGGGGGGGGGGFGGGGFSYPPCGYCPGGGGTSGTYTPPPAYGSTDFTNCNKCKKDLQKKAVDKLVDKAVEKAIGFNPNEKLKTIGITLVTIINPAAGALLKFALDLKDMIDLLNTIASCTPYLGFPPSLSGGAVGTSSRVSSSDLGDAYVQVAEDMEQVLLAFLAENYGALEYFDSLIYTNAWLDLAPLIEPYVVLKDSIPDSVQTVVINAMVGYDVEAYSLEAFFDRWNTSIYARSQGISSPNATYPNIINWDTIGVYEGVMDSSLAYANDLGYGSVMELFSAADTSLVSLLFGEKDAVCASVTVQFKQQLTMTREAFEGTLVIYNGHPTDSLDSLTVDIMITDENGVPSNGLFQINTTSLTNLSDVQGTGAIAAEEEGTVQFLFIPTIAAAPTTPKVYNFGGSATYWDPFVQDMVTLPLADVPITVNPSPNLMLHYFMQRNILGDDALTTPIEPMVPAELAVMIENQGYGPAVNLAISAAQPEIIENEKGLAINFSLIGSNLQGQPAQLGLTNINFGTIPKLSTRIGQWYFTSSLLGKFVSYEAEVVHESSFGNPDLSLIKGIQLHELTRSIKVYGALDDGINDFLVNDYFDPADVPDEIYISQGLDTFKVYPADSGSFSSPVQPPTFTNVLTVHPSDTGWNYIKLDDPGLGAYELVSVTRDDAQEIPLDNAWLTFVTLPVTQSPVYEDKFHMVDDFPSLDPVEYTVVWSPKATDVPEVDTIIGAPKQVTTEQVTNLAVVFTKEIDSSSFTYDDMTLVLQGGPNIMDASVVITQIDPYTFDLDLSSLTTGNGFYILTVQAAGVQDIYGINGLTGKQAKWTQWITVPAVQEFRGLPPNNIASSFDTLEVYFNLPIDSSTVIPERFSVYKDSVLLSDTLSVDSFSTDKRSYYLSGLADILTEDGEYEIVVDVPNIQSVDQVFGMEQQSITLSVDNIGPLTAALVTSNSGGLDPQHVTFVEITFEEEVVGFNTASIELTRNGDVIPLNIAQLARITPAFWKGGNFGMATYLEGEYTFTVNLGGLTDVLGNSGDGSVQITWVVDRSATIAITGLGIDPDLGYSSTDGISSDLAFNVNFTLSDSASQVTISQTSFGSAFPLKTLQNLSNGAHSIPVVFPTGGNTGVKVVANGANGGFTSADKTLFLDESPLGGEWSFTSGQVLSSQIDSMSFLFSDKLLSDTGWVSALQFTRNNASLPISGLGFLQVDDTTYEVTGLNAVSNVPGSYALNLDLAAFHKYTSGKSGLGTAAVSWSVEFDNAAPVADAGSDFVADTTATYVLNGSASYDPDGDSLTYKWVAPQGLVLDDNEIAEPSFEVDPTHYGNTYSFLLIVDDGSLINSDVVEITVIECGNNGFCDDGDSCTIDECINGQCVYTSVCDSGTITLGIKAFLGGPYIDSTGLMHDSLRIMGYIPLEEPYIGLGYTHYQPGGGEAIDTMILLNSGNDAIVDWVFIELRDKEDSTHVLATKSALIQRDGDIVETDGVFPVTFKETPDDEYYLAVRHRNHLGVMTSSPVSMSESIVLIDFTSPVTSTYGTDAQNDMPSGTYVLWSGNIVLDKYLKYSGLNNDRDAILRKIGGLIPNNTEFGYLSEDINMDGVVKYGGLNNDRDVLLFNIGGFMPTNTVAEQLPE